MDEVREKRRQELVKILESFDALEKSEEWQSLKELVFGKSLESIERQLLNASIESPINLEKMYNLQGQRSWAKRYTEGSLIEGYKKELVDLKKRLNESNN